MSFFSRIVVLAAFVLAGCGSSNSGSSGTDIRTLVPADNEVTGWTRTGSLKVLTDAQAMEGYPSGGFDGDTEPYHDAGLTQVAEQHFVYNSIATNVRVWQLTSATAATTAYNDTRTGAGTGDSVSIGEAGRIFDDGVNLTLVVRKGVYVIYSQIAADTAEANTQIQALVTAIANKIQ